ncbi:hypothetical protein VTN31DRAFT_2511 [Thermomyces dupontii]|uniref:uncharacterized protein n=1 Tax=Talaromyces thermophilus TaxID=28565 RepID=UPI0037435300
MNEYIQTSVKLLRFSKKNFSSHYPSAPSSGAKVRPLSISGNPVPMASNGSLGMFLGLAGGRDGPAAVLAIVNGYPVLGSRPQFDMNGPSS